jgi:uncharacterized protein (DUF1778 family)
MCAAEAHIDAVPTMTKERKSERLVARVSVPDKLLFEQAALVEGRSVATFVIAHAREAAERTVRERHFIRLDEKKSREFMEALLAPSRKPTAALKQAMARYRGQVTEA